MPGDRPRRSQKIYLDAGFPAGAYNNIYATNDQIETVIADPRVQGVSLTGSERAGAAVAEIAGRNLKKVVLELGGSDPFILLCTDDLDATVEAAVSARLDNTGQSCNAAKRFIVIDDLYQPFLEKFTAAMSAAAPGDPTGAGHRDRAALVDHRRRPARGSGQTARSRTAPRWCSAASATATSSRPRSWPTSARRRPRPARRSSSARSRRSTGSDPRTRRSRLANDTPFGLGSYVFTTDADQAERVANKIDAGMVYVNLVGADGAELPFGGVKRSGFGRELGRYGADEFVNKKLIRVG